MKTSEKHFLLLFTSFERQLPGVRETSTDSLPKVHSGQSGPGGSQESRPKYRPPTQGQGPENLIHYLVALRVYLSRKLHQNRRSLAGSGHSHGIQGTQCLNLCIQYPPLRALLQHGGVFVWDGIMPYPPLRVPQRHGCLVALPTLGEHLTLCASYAACTCVFCLPVCCSPPFLPTKPVLSRISPAFPFHNKANVPSNT